MKTLATMIEDFFSKLEEFQEKTGTQIEETKFIQEEEDYYLELYTQDSLENMNTNISGMFMPKVTLEEIESEIEFDGNGDVEAKYIVLRYKIG